MSIREFKNALNSLCLLTLLVASASPVRAATLNVHCGGSGGLNSIGAALKALKYSESNGPSTINVSGACHENVQGRTESAGQMALAVPIGPAVALRST